MKYRKLIEARKTKGFTQKQMATKVLMEQTTYSRKERGKSPINEEEWVRIAKILDIPVEEIKEVGVPISIKNKKFTFKEDSINTQYVYIPQDVFDIIIKYNQKLEEENLMLKNQLNFKGI